jgi:hypothetical protein
MKRGFLVALLVIGCGDDAGFPPPAAHPPAAPTQNASNFQWQARSWLMAGDGLTPKDQTWDVLAAVTDGASYVDLWVDDTPGQRMQKNPDGTFHLAVVAPPVGDHTVIFAADGAATALAQVPLHVSHAIYTVVSTDWDDSDNSDTNYQLMDQLRMRHPSLVMTQFFGPYVITDTVVAAARRASNIAYMKLQHDMYGDEIGVHIHPWCSFVNTTPVTCRTMPSDTMPMGDTSGYTVIFSSYTTDEQTQLLQSATDLFMQNGLGRPTSFRAGGWTADITTIEACTRAGYTVESSAFPPQTIQSAWPGTLFAMWTLEHWSMITQTSQPYYPSMMDIQNPMPLPEYPVLEVPDNGTLTDYMSAQAMIDVLGKNWAGSTLDTSSNPPKVDGGAVLVPTIFQIGFHPPSFFQAYYARLDPALGEVDRHLYKDDAGPISYARLVDLKKVSIWSAAHP